MNKLTLDEQTEPWVYYEDNILPGDEENLDVESFKGNDFGMIKSDPVCGIIQISGQLHIEQLPCDDHHDALEDDADIRDYDSKDENFKHEVIKPEIDNNTTTEFDAERNDAEKADLHEVDDEDHDYRDHDAVQADRLEVQEEGIEGGEGFDDHGEEDSVEEEELEDEDNPEEFDEDEDYGAKETLKLYTAEIEHKTEEDKMALSQRTERTLVVEVVTWFIYSLIYSSLIDINVQYGGR